MSHLPSVGTSLSMAAAAIAVACSLAGCEGDSFGYATRKPPTYKGGGSGNSTPAQTNGDPGSSPPSSSPPSQDPTPDPQTTPSPDGGTTKADASPPATSAPGTCGNPKCAAGNGLCGCKATDGAGNMIVMGCQDGACACLDGNGNDTNDFNATCDDPASAAIAFQQCACN